MQLLDRQAGVRQKLPGLDSTILNVPKVSKSATMIELFGFGPERMIKFYFGVKRLH